MRAGLPLLSLAAGCSVATAAGLSRCGVEPSESFVAKAGEAFDEEARGAFDMIDDHICIDTYFHVVAGSDKPEDGYISDKLLKDQLQVLNDGFAPHGVSFHLLNTTRTINPDWATNGTDTAEIDMKKSLRQGDYGTLNAYFLQNLGDILGFCPFPTDVTDGSDEFFLDGCTVIANTAPGGTSAPYNLGGTLIHEVGHFLGLFHTFQDGCAGGDLIDDTPPQKSQSSGCPIGRDSCKLPGLDPIHNYMDYSDDACYEEFTPGQERRIYNMWNKFRA